MLSKEFMLIITQEEHIMWRPLHAAQQKSAGNYQVDNDS